MKDDYDSLEYEEDLNEESVCEEEVDFDNEDADDEVDHLENGNISILFGKHHNLTFQQVYKANPG